MVAAAVFKRNVNVSVCLLGLLFEGRHPVRCVLGRTSDCC